MNQFMNVSVETCLDLPSITDIQTVSVLRMGSLLRLVCDISYVWENMSAVQICGE